MRNAIKSSFINTPTEYRILYPQPALSDYVESCWMLINPTGEPRPVVILPDGRVDLIFSCSPTEPFRAMIMGLDDEPSYSALLPSVVMCAVSFKLPAVEYLFHTSISGLLNEAQLLPEGFWNITAGDLSDFDNFCLKINNRIASLLPADTDNRKLELFRLIYASNGSISVKELSEKVYWSSRQINRYFNQQFGLSLKAYCNILRFRASFGHIKEGRLFPEEAFADQAHFIKEVKKFAGVPPKELSKNKDDRFIQFSTLPKK